MVSFSAAGQIYLFLISLIRDIRDIRVIRGQTFLPQAANLCASVLICGQPVFICSYT
jgi:hypothetical protein